MSGNKKIKSLMSMKIIVAAFFILLPSFLTAAGNIRISISDFQVQSENAQYKYLGKGFAEFIGIDIIKAPNVELVDREKRVEAIKEQELSQTGLIDENSQIKIGKILAANYIIYGNIYDFSGQLSITFKVVDTETSKVLIQDKVDGKLLNYGYLSAVISQKILTVFSIQAPEAVAARAQKPVDKEEKAAINFSNAMDAYDKKDTGRAKKELEKARELDPENDAVKIYLKKLIVNTAKFKTMTEAYYPDQNPAYLGIIKYDKLFLSLGGSNFMTDRVKINNHNKYLEEGPDFNVHLGYQFPIGESFGACIEGIISHYEDRLLPNSSGGDGEIVSRAHSFGGIASMGWSINNSLSIGGGGSLYKQLRYNSIPNKSEIQENKLYSSFFAGFLLKNEDSTIMFDSLGGYSNEKRILLDAVTSTVGKEVKAPIYNENGITIALLDKRLFLALKEINSIYTDRDYYVGRLIPAVEYWFVNWFSLRGGIEGSYVKMEGTKKTGLGWTAGLSLRHIGSGVEFDVNYTERKRPSRVVAGQVVDEPVIYFAISKSNIAFSR
jgi:TolB-like protein